jgi:hypothetical protein
VRKEVRNLVVFATHSMLKDPPFSRLDLISCRNLLIYLEREVQTQLLGTLRYALKPDGFLFLGSHAPGEFPKWIAAGGTPRNPYTDKAQIPPGRPTGRPFRCCCGRGVAVVRGPAPRGKKGRRPPSGSGIPAGEGRIDARAPSKGEPTMAEVHYHIVEHDGGWTYQVGDVFAETYRTRAEAEAAAFRAAREQRVPSDPAAIAYEDEQGVWHEEHSDGEPPATDVD